jgi:hypothetical protein
LKSLTGELPADGRGYDAGYTEPVSTRHNAYAALGRHAGFLMAPPTSLNNDRRHRNAVRPDASALLNISYLAP